MQIQKWVESEAERVYAQNPFFRAIEEGTFDRRALARYLFNLAFLVSRTPQHLAASLETARREGHEQLAKFLEHKVHEETGHNLWAEEDLRSLSLSPEELDSLEVLPPVHGLVEGIMRVASNDLPSYFGYMFLAEYVTVYLGTRSIEGWEKHCGIPAKHLSVITKHLEIDRHHVQEDLEIMAPLMERVRVEEVRGALALYESFLAQVVQSEARRHAPQLDPSISAP